MDVMAHRYAYEIEIGEIPEGLVIDHLCHNPHECPPSSDCPHRKCVNPSHLKAVPNADNVRRGGTGWKFGTQQLAKTHCPQGHPYDEANTGRDRLGRRSCRTCSRARGRARYAAKKTKT
jgi:hypothetical protein